MNISASLQMLAIDGHQMAVLPISPDAKGTPVFFIHGVTQSIYFWIQPFVAPFRDVGPCYAVSLPGHYPAQFPKSIDTASLTPEVFARLIAASIRQVVGDRKVILVGHSLGGLSSLAIAALHPEMVERVVSVVGYAQGKWTGILGMYQRWAQGNALGRMMFRLAGFNGLGVLYALTEGFRMRGKSGDTHAFYASPHWNSLFEATSKAGVRPDWGAMQQAFAAAAGMDIRDLLPKIQAPTLVIGADGDWLVPPEQSQLVAEHVPHSTLTMIPGAGHYPMLEDTDAYCRAIAEWLAA